MHKIAMHHLQRKFSVAASFKLVRTNLFPDNGNVFDYTLDQKGEQETREMHQISCLYSRTYHSNISTSSQNRLDVGGA